jgi:hypothetical protein
MKTKRETLSDTLDIIKNITKRKEEKAKRDYTKWEAKIEKYINKQFNIAKRELGHRLTIRKQHETMYYIGFDTGSNVGLMFYTCLRSESLTTPSKTKWELVKYNGYNVNNLYTDTCYEHVYEYDLKDLDKVIIDYVNTYFEKLGVL